jgi:hypothetical protein
MPGEARNMIPRIRARSPHRRRIHQGKSPGAQHPHEHPHGSVVAVVSVIVYLRNYTRTLP